MSEDFNVIGYFLTSNIDVELHEQGELEHLTKKKVISKNLVEYNKKLHQYLSQSGFDNKQEQGTKAKCKKLVKQMSKMNQLSQIDRISILNNKFANQAQLILKVKNCQKLTNKEKAIILEHQLSK